MSGGYQHSPKSGISSNFSSKSGLASTQFTPRSISGISSGYTQILSTQGSTFSPTTPHKSSQGIAMTGSHGTNLIHGQKVKPSYVSGLHFQNQVSEVNSGLSSSTSDTSRFGVNVNPINTNQKLSYSHQNLKRPYVNNLSSNMPLSLIHKGSKSFEEHSNTLVPHTIQRSDSDPTVHNVQSTDNLLSKISNSFLLGEQYSSEMS